MSLAEGSRSATVRLMANLWETSRLARPGALASRPAGAWTESTDSNGERDPRHGASLRSEPDREFPNQSFDVNLVDYVPFDLRGFPANRKPLIDLYIRIRDQYVLYCPAETIFSIEARQRLVAGNMTELYIRLIDGQIGAGQLKLASLIALPDNQVAPVVKARVFYHAALSTARLMFTAPSEPMGVTSAREAATSIAALLSNRPDTLHMLIAMMNHDTSVYSHSVNVCAYATGLGQQIGVTGDDLFNLSLGAFLHDAGKTRVPESILTKAGPLTQADWAIIKKHPEWGLQLVEEATRRRPIAQTIVFEHHERMNGSGYPRGLGGNQIHPMARLVALVDAYDALTAARYSREPHTPFEALRIIREDMKGQFDDDLFVQFVQLLAGKQPIDNWVVSVWSRATGEEHRATRIGP